MAPIQVAPIQGGGVVRNQPDQIRTYASTFTWLADELRRENAELNHQRHARGRFYGNQEPGQDYAIRVLPLCDTEAEEAELVADLLDGMGVNLDASGVSWDSTDHSGAKQLAGLSHPPAEQV